MGYLVAIGDIVGIKGHPERFGKVLEANGEDVTVKLINSHEVATFNVSSVLEWGEMRFDSIEEMEVFGEKAKNL